MCLCYTCRSPYPRSILTHGLTQRTQQSYHRCQLLSNGPSPFKISTCLHRAWRVRVAHLVCTSWPRGLFSFSICLKFLSFKFRHQWRFQCASPSCGRLARTSGFCEMAFAGSRSWGPRKSVERSLKHLCRVDTTLVVSRSDYGYWVCIPF